MRILAEEWQRTQHCRCVHTNVRPRSTWSSLHKQSESTTVNKGMTCFIQDAFSRLYFSFVSSCMCRNEHKKGNRLLKVSFCEWELRQLNSLRHDRLYLQCCSSLVTCHLVLEYTAHRAAQGRQGHPGGAQAGAGPLPPTPAAPSPHPGCSTGGALAQEHLLFMPHPSCRRCVPRRCS